MATIDKKTQAYWNKQAKIIGTFCRAPSTRYYRVSEMELITHGFGDTKGKKLLKLDLWNEVNNTQILYWLAQQGASIYGLDISDYLVRKALAHFKKKGLQATLIVSDVRRIDFNSNYFDFVYTMGTIEHDPSNYETSVREIFRVLKPQGKCIVGVPNKYDPFLRPLLVWFLTCFHLYPYAPEKSFSKKELKHLLEKMDLLCWINLGFCLCQDGFAW